MPAKKAKGKAGAGSVGAAKGKAKGSGGGAKPKSSDSKKKLLRREPMSVMAEAIGNACDDLVSDVCELIAAYAAAVPILCIREWVRVHDNDSTHEPSHYEASQLYALLPNGSTRATPTPLHLLSRAAANPPDVSKLTGAYSDEIAADFNRAQADAAELAAEQAQERAEAALKAAEAAAAAGKPKPKPIVAAKPKVVAAAATAAALDAESAFFARRSLRPTGWAEYDPELMSYRACYRDVWKFNLPEPPYPDASATPSSSAASAGASSEPPSAEHVRVGLQAAGSVASGVMAPTLAAAAANPSAGSAAAPFLAMNVHGAPRALTTYAGHFEIEQTLEWHISSALRAMAKSDGLPVGQAVSDRVASGAPDFIPSQPPRDGAPPVPLTALPDNLQEHSTDRYTPVLTAPELRALAPCVGQEKLPRMGGPNRTVDGTSRLQARLPLIGVFVPAPAGVDNADGSESRFALVSAERGTHFGRAIEMPNLKPKEADAPAVPMISAALVGDSKTPAATPVAGSAAALVAILNTNRSALTATPPTAATAAALSPQSERRDRALSWEYRAGTFGIQHAVRQYAETAVAHNLPHSRTEHDVLDRLQCMAPFTTFWHGQARAAVDQAFRDYVRERRGDNHLLFCTALHRANRALLEIGNSVSGLSSSDQVALAAMPFPTAQEDADLYPPWQFYVNTIPNPKAVDAYDGVTGERIAGVCVMLRNGTIQHMPPPMSPVLGRGVSRQWLAFDGGLPGLNDANCKDESDTDGTGQNTKRVFLCSAPDGLHVIAAFDTKVKVFNVATCVAADCVCVCAVQTSARVTSLLVLSDRSFAVGTSGGLITVYHWSSSLTDAQVRLYSAAAKASLTRPRQTAAANTFVPDAQFVARRARRSPKQSPKAAHSVVLTNCLANAKAAESVIDGNAPAVAAVASAVLARAGAAAGAIPIPLALTPAAAPAAPAEAAAGDSKSAAAPATSPVLTPPASPKAAPAAAAAAAAAPTLTEAEAKAVAATTEADAKATTAVTAAFAALPPAAPTPAVATAGAVFAGHRDRVDVLIKSRAHPDTIVSGSADGTVRWWSLTLNRELRAHAPLRPGVGAVTSVAELGDGRVLIGGTNGLLQSWPSTVVFGAVDLRPTILHPRFFGQLSVIEHYEPAWLDLL